MSDPIIVCAVSDMHGHLPAIPPCDLLLLCGDNAPDFGGNNISAPLRQAHWYNSTFTEWLHNVQAVTGATVFGIGGNHDIALFRHKYALDFDIPWTYLQDEGGEFRGLTIWGSPWIHNCPGWSFNLEPKQLEERFSRIPEGTDILMLHGPPHGHGDWAPAGSPHFSGREQEGEYCGAGAANKAIERVKPKLVCFGHIHEGHGTSMIGNSRLINASVVNNRYQMVFPATILHLDAPVPAALGSSLNPEEEEAYGIT